MGKRNIARERIKQRKQNQKNNRTMMVGVAGLLLVIIAIAAMTFSNTGGDIPPEEAGRMGLDPVLGNPDAPVTIIEYGAYGCPACRTWHQAGIIDQILDAYGDQVNFVFRDFPVISPAYDTMAAEIAQCALDQSEDGFWAFHDALYSFVTVGSAASDLMRVGAQVGLDAGALSACYDAGTHRETVKYDENRARSLGLRGTPSFMVNDQRLYTPSPEGLQQAIEEALRS